MSDESMMKVCREAARDRPALQRQCGQKHPPRHPFSIPATVPPAASWAKGILSSPSPSSFNRSPAKSGPSGRGKALRASLECGGSSLSGNRCKSLRVPQCCLGGDQATWVNVFAPARTSFRGRGLGLAGHLLPRLKIGVFGAGWFFLSLSFQQFSRQPIFWRGRGSETVGKCQLRQVIWLGLGPRAVQEGDLKLRPRPCGLA